MPCRKVCMCNLFCPDLFCRVRGCGKSRLDLANRIINPSTSQASCLYSRAGAARMSLSCG